MAFYSIFNDASIRDDPFKAPQGTPGKTCDDTSASGPWFVTTDKRLPTRLNGQVMQEASISDLVFSAASLILILPTVFTRKPGIVIGSGSPSCVGPARKPPGALAILSMDGFNLTVPDLQVAGGACKALCPDLREKGSRLYTIGSGQRRASIT